MAGATAEAGAPEATSEGLIRRGFGSRLREDREVGCTHARQCLPEKNFAVYIGLHRTNPSRRCAASWLPVEMNKFERQSSSADIQTLPDDIAEELSRLPSEVLSVDDAPSLAPPAPLSQDEVRTIVISLMLTMFLAALDQTIVATALPTIGRQFHDVSNLSWVITAYLLASTAVAPVFGSLSDIYGRRVMIIISLSLFVAGSLLCAIAPNLPMLILARGRFRDWVAAASCLSCRP
ncbi:hypothetical protein ACVWZZ_007318 [Bradyrhizobium sp. LM6.10]